jgi:hypothetical protein
MRYGVAFAELVYFQGESFLRVCIKLNIHLAYSAKRFGNKFDTKCMYPAYLYESKLSPNCPQLLGNYCCP